MTNIISNVTDDEIDTWLAQDSWTDRKRLSYQLKAARHELLAARKLLKEALELVNTQANDAGLWFNADYITEEYLQEALRKLHRVLEQE